MSVSFPDGFLWGTATAAYQVEGAAREDGRGQSIWDMFARMPGKIFHGDTGDCAADQYHHWESDLDLMVDLNHQAHRLSVAWPRIQPEGRGAVNQRGLDYYRRFIDGLVQRNIKPAITLYHWDLPQALQDDGGWANRDTADRFAEYAAIVHRALGDRNPLWMTLNEPWCSAFLGHHLGRHAPGLTNEAAALRATHHLLLGHGKAIQAMRTQGDSDSQLGIVLNLVAVQPRSSDHADIAAATRVDGTRNRLYLDPLLRRSYPQDIVSHYAPISDFSFVQDGDLDLIASPIDFLGVNYYNRYIVGSDPADPKRGAVIVPSEGPASATGVGIHPEGLTQILVRLKDEYTHMPLYVTENGIALYDYVDPEGQVDDDERIAYLEGHFRAALDAIRQGVDLKGFLVWSLLDTFEWERGYSVRYGIVYVDYATQRRTPKRSAYWYRDVIRRNGFVG